LRALAKLDVRHALPMVAVPTLIVHASRDANVPIGAARLTHDLIPGSKLVELDSDIHLIWVSDMIPEVAAEIEAFVNQTFSPVEVDRVLATVLAVAPPTLSRRSGDAIDAIVERFCGRPLQGTVRATFDGPARAIRCARALLAELGATDPGLAVAVHSGECELTDDGVRGPAVDLAEQLAASAEPGQVLVSQTVRDLLAGSTTRLEPRGRRSFEQVPGEWDVFAVASESVTREGSDGR
jgi:class 3 adenylate cyclase